MNRFLKSFVGLLAAQAMLLVAGPAQADTIAWWRFEDGVNGQIIPGSQNGTVWQIGVQDVSGNGNHLVARTDSSDSASVSRYDASVPPVVTGTNLFSMKNTGGSPSLYTWSAMSNPTRSIEDMEFSQWTVEVFFRPNADTASTAANNHRTMVGWDGQHPIDEDGRSVLYVKLLSGSPMVEYGDAAGSWYGPRAGDYVVQADHWYYYAVRNDGQSLQLWIADLSAGETQATMILESQLTSTDTRMIPRPKATTNYPPRPRKSWSVGRGFWGGTNETDFFFGNIDEVRVSDAALDITTEGLLATGLPVSEDEPPAMKFTSPQHTQQFNLGTTVTLTAEVTEGTIAGPVVFSVDGTTIGLVQNAPYTMEWMPPHAGTFNLSVVGYDGDEELIDRAAPSITVVDPIDVKQLDLTLGGDGVAGTVTSSSDYNTDDGDDWNEQDAFAFDDNNATFWTSQNTLANENPAWLQIQLNTPGAINAFSLLGRTSGNYNEPQRLPRDFSLLGSNDGVNWTTLYSVNGHSTIQRTVFQLDSKTQPYTYYRIAVTQTLNGEATQTNIAELELLNLPMILTVSSSRSRINLSTPDAANTVLTASFRDFEGEVETVQFFDGVRSLGYGTRNEDGSFSATVYPFGAGTMQVYALVWTADGKVYGSTSPLEIDVDLFVNAVPLNLWTMH